MAENADIPGSWSTTLAALGGVVLGALGFATALASGWFEYAGKDQELKVHLVEIAISILRADPKEDVGAARGWALDIIERNSGVPFSADDRATLLHKPLGALAYFQSVSDADAQRANEVNAQAWRVKRALEAAEAARQKEGHDKSPSEPKSAQPHQ